MPGLLAVGSHNLLRLLVLLVARMKRLLLLHFVAIVLADGQLLELAAVGLEGLQGRFRNSVCADGKVLSGEFTTPEDLVDVLLCVGHHAGIDKSREVDNGPVRHLVKVVKLDNTKASVLVAWAHRSSRILGETTVQRRLSTFETSANSSSGTRVLSSHTLSTRTTLSRGVPTSEPPAAVSRSRLWRKVGQSKSLGFSSNRNGAHAAHGGDTRPKECAFSRRQSIL
mmetsp:Transcript_22134/g.43018  ORF Transcript_22134/g.43018 Transcript_22134/m.43018 type:complete len:225 (-) Transcript_22134:97-771(-)